MLYTDFSIRSNAGEWIAYYHTKWHEPKFNCLKKNKWLPQHFWTTWTQKWIKTTIILRWKEQSLLLNMPSGWKYTRAKLRCGSKSRWRWWRWNLQIESRNNRRPAAYKTMEQDALNGRSFEDMVVEYDTSYRIKKPLIVYGGQHRLRAIEKAKDVKGSVFHGVRVYFDLSREQKVEIATVKQYINSSSQWSIGQNAWTIAWFRIKRLVSKCGATRKRRGLRR